MLYLTIYLVNCSNVDKTKKKRSPGMRKTIANIQVAAQIVFTSMACSNYVTSITSLVWFREPQFFDSVSHPYVCTWLPVQTHAYKKACVDRSARGRRSDGQVTPKSHIQYYALLTHFSRLMWIAVEKRIARGFPCTKNWYLLFYKCDEGLTTTQLWISKTLIAFITL